MKIAIPTMDEKSISSTLAVARPSWFSRSRKAPSNPGKFERTGKVARATIILKATTMATLVSCGSWGIASP